MAPSGDQDRRLGGQDGMRIGVMKKITNEGRLGRMSTMRRMISLLQAMRRRRLSMMMMTMILTMGLWRNQGAETKTVPQRKEVVKEVMRKILAPAPPESNGGVSSTRM